MPPPLSSQNKAKLFPTPHFKKVGFPPILVPQLWSLTVMVAQTTSPSPFIRSLPFVTCLLLFGPGLFISPLPITRGGFPFDPHLCLDFLCYFSDVQELAFVRSLGPRTFVPSPSARGLPFRSNAMPYDFSRALLPSKPDSRVSAQPFPHSILER